MQSNLVVLQGPVVTGRSHARLYVFFFFCPLVDHFNAGVRNESYTDIISVLVEGGNAPIYPANEEVRGKGRGNPFQTKTISNKTMQKRRQYYRLLSFRNVCYDALNCFTFDNLADYAAASSGMFTQIDDLSIPGAGIRSTGYSSDVNNMLVDLLVSNNAGSSQVQMQPTPSPPTMPMRSLVRTYGSEQELSVCSLKLRANFWQYALTFR